MQKLSRYGQGGTSCSGVVGVVVQRHLPISSFEGEKLHHGVGVLR